MTVELPRGQLLSMLSEACELEHSLACSYLFAAFSLKQGPNDGLSWRDQQDVRLWAAQVYFVASQEMLHLAQAWNLITAIGGTPYYFRPPFPQARGYVPIDAQLSLTRYSEETLQRFLRWEEPEKVRPERRYTLAEKPDLGDAPYATVGELYSRIEGGIRDFKGADTDLFIGDPFAQIGPELADFPDLKRVVDRASALAAIDEIRRQGEGTRDDPDDCHFGVFHRLLVDLQKRNKEDPAFDPALPVVANPSRRNFGGATQVVGEDALAAMGLFDDIYGLSLRMLSWVFGPALPRQALTPRLARAAITAMPVVIKPLGEALARLDFGDGTKRAGAPFTLTRHVPFPAEPALVELLVRESFEDLARQVDRVLARPALVGPLGFLPRQLEVVRRFAFS